MPETFETPDSRRPVPSNTVGSSAVGSGSAVLCAAALVLAAGKAEIVLKADDFSLVAVAISINLLCEVLQGSDCHSWLMNVDIDCGEINAWKNDSPKKEQVDRYGLGKTYVLMAP